MTDMSMDEFRRLACGPAWRFVQRTADKARSGVGCTRGGRPHELVQSSSENDRLRQSWPCPPHSQKQLSNRATWTAEFREPPARRFQRQTSRAKPRRYWIEHSLAYDFSVFRDDPIKNLVPTSG